MEWPKLEGSVLFRTKYKIIVVIRPHKVKFPVSGPTSHLKMTRPPGFFFFSRKPKRKGRGVPTAKCIVEGEVWKQDYEMQTIVYLRSQNIEAWMEKPLSSGCVNTMHIHHPPLQLRYPQY